MKLLLDTHVWVWSQAQSRRLNQQTRRLLQNTRNELWLSPASVWEFVDLSRRNRFGLIADPLAWVEEALSRMPVRDAPLTRQVAMEAGRFRMVHNDPMDHLIVATARALDLTLVTADQSIIASKVVKVAEAG